MMGKKTEPAESVPCGNTVALVGIDNYLSKSCTITSIPQSYPLANMKYSVYPVVRVAVAPKNPADLLKLVEALKRLSKSDPLVVCSVENTGEHIVACAGELHLDICINDLKEFMNGAELVVSKPVVSYRETVTGASSVVCLAKSPNTHNRLWCQAEPISTELINLIEEGPFVKQEMKARAKVLQNQFHWNATDARSIFNVNYISYSQDIWAFGPDSTGPNVVVDCTKGVPYMHETKDSINSAFQWVTREGVLAEETVRGVRFSIMDALLHSDAVHRGAGQIIPTARKAFYAAQLTAKPNLFEPVFLVEMQCPPQAMSGVSFLITIGYSLRYTVA